MRSRTRFRASWPAAVLAGLLAGTAALAGCTAEPALPAVGDPLDRDDAAVLAGLLHGNHRAGGADFVITAPYRDGVVLTLTGEVDFREGTGRAEAVTSFGTDRADDVRTVFFTAEEIWTGDLPGLDDALAAEGEQADYLRRDLTLGDEDGPLLTDVLVTVLLRLSAESPDDASAFVAAEHTWQGQRSIDSRLTTVFGLRDGRTVAVSAADDRLVQFSTPLLDGAVVATVTLADHGPRTVPLPDDDATAEAADHPGIAVALGI